MDSLNETQGIVLRLLGQSLFSLPFVPDPSTDWDAVLAECRAQAVDALALRDYRSLPLDAEMAAFVKQLIRERMLANMACFQNHSYLHRLMSEHGIPYCVIKGAASARYYPEPLLRSMGDVDFFVPPTSIAQAVEVLEKEGFVKQELEHRYHIALHKGRMHFELHFDAIAVPQSTLGAVFREYWSDICEQSVQVKDDFAEYRMAQTFLHGFILLSHLQAHLLAEGVGLRHVCDWVVFANAFSDAEFKETFEQKLKRAGLWRMAQALCLAAVEYMGMPYRAWMGEDRDTAQALLEDILSGGNFGRKSRQRGYESFFVSDNAMGGVKRNRVLQAIRSVNCVVDSHWRAARKFPLLYPIGWVYFSIRFLIKRLQGKRNVAIMEAYVTSRKRKALYERLHLLNPEE